MTLRQGRGSRAGAFALLAAGALCSGVDLLAYGQVPPAVSAPAVSAPAVSAPAVSAAASSPPAASAAAASASAKPVAPARPYWIELTTAQRDALSPLSQDWERLDLQTKMKWVEIANRYPRMRPEEKARTQQRMREWALLTPDQRRVARDSFARIQQMNPEQRADLLRKYRELPPERRQALVTQGQANKAIVVPRPTTAPVPRRTELNEGAKVRNPAVAAQKSASPLVAPARPAATPARIAPTAPPPVPPVSGQASPTGLGTVVAPPATTAAPAVVPPAATATP